jgi:hypothetical protein
MYPHTADNPKNTEEKRIPPNDARSSLPSKNPITLIATTATPTKVKNSRPISIKKNISGF